MNDNIDDKLESWQNGTSKKMKHNSKEDKISEETTPEKNELMGSCKCCQNKHDVDENKVSKVSIGSEGDEGNESIKSSKSENKKSSSSSDDTFQCIKHFTSHNYSQIFDILSKANPRGVIIKSMNGIGDIEFYISAEQLGFTPYIIREFKKDLFGRFIPSVIGEFLVRENINQFAEAIAKISPEAYANAVDSSKHYKFGMSYNNKRKIFTFMFHLSFLQEIMVEDFVF